MLKTQKRKNFPAFQFIERTLFEHVCFHLGLKTVYLTACQCVSVCLWRRSLHVQWNVVGESQ